MGTWNAGLFCNDTTCDVRDTYLNFLKLQLNNEEAYIIGSPIDVYFSMKHIRYIAVNDGIDTLLENNDIAPFKNTLNDMYAKDLSRKVKSAKHQRAKNGFYISSQPPYGYKVDPYNRNRLVVDEEAAKTVKYIFELASTGISLSEISRILEQKRIISPSVYKVMNGDTRFLKFTSKSQLYKWPYQTIKSIMCNQVYVGDMVNHQVETVNYKTKERAGIPPENQIIVPNTHEAIIDRKTFDTINAPSSKRRRANHHYKNIFKGLIFCTVYAIMAYLYIACRGKHINKKYICGLFRIQCTQN